MILYHCGNLDKLTNSKTICEVHFFICRFGLFEAMSAIEMMDPKMDAGMIGNQVNRKVLNFEQGKGNQCLLSTYKVPTLLIYISLKSYNNCIWILEIK